MYRIKHTHIFTLSTYIYLYRHLHIIRTHTHILKYSIHHTHAYMAPLISSSQNVTCTITLSIHYIWVTIHYLLVTTHYKVMPLHLRADDLVDTLYGELE